MDEIQKFEMIAAMRVFGGDFVKALAECFTRADHSNFQRLCNAFPEYVKQYSEMAKHIEHPSSGKDV